MDAGFKLDELAKAAGISPRTVRYYVQRGLLPAPTFRGKDTAYGTEHLLRLRAIRALQEQFLPLDEIQARLEGLSRAGLEAVATQTKPPAAPVSKTEPPHHAAARFEPAARLTRWVLAPGLELTLTEDADERARALADQLREAARNRHGGAKR